MSLLHRLPIELCQTVSLSWLDLIDLTRLDSAVCAHHERATFLKAVFAANCVYDYSRYFGKEKTRKGALFYKPEFHEWILLRGVRLSSFASFPSVRVLQHKIAFMEIIRTSGTCLKTVQTHMDFDMVKEALYTHCTVLERLECGKVGKRGGLERLLEACPSLQHLTFESTDTSALAVLQEFSAQIMTLRMASVGKCTLPPPQWANLVPYLTNLTDLEVARDCPYDTVLTAVGTHCPHLRSLMITSFATSASGTCSEALLAVAKGCPNLERLHVGGSVHITGSVWLEILQGCSKLTVLQVRSFHTDSDEVMAVLARDFPALRELQVNYFTDLHKLSPQHIASWPLLEVLDLGNMSIADELLYALGAHCPRLRLFSAEFCPTITDVGVTALAKGCPMLENVYLGHCLNITFAALDAIITHCRYLERLTIHQAHAPGCITREKAEPYLKLKLGDINAYAFLDSLAQQGRT